MTRKLGALWMVLLGSIAIALTGCGQASPSPDTSGQKQPAAAAPATQNAAPAASAASETKVGASPALSADDRKLIQEQKVCPVSGEPLGTMGDPVKVVVKGRTVFLCCDGCKETLMADTDKYLKKLDQKK